MNITMNSATLPAPSDAAGVTGAAPAEALPLDPALAAAQQGAQSPLAFLQFMQLGAAIPGEPLPQPELDAAVQGEMPDAAAPAASEAQEEGGEAALEAAQPLLAAMSMPLTPAMMTMPAALPAALRLAAGAPQRQERAADAVPAAAGAVELPSAPAARGETAMQAAQPTLAPESVGAHLARASAATAQPTAAPQQLAAAAAAPREGAVDAQPAAAGGAGADAGFGIAAQSAPSAPAAGVRDGGTLSLSGPPTAWRQSLQEALGERLNLSVGKNAEQAVIRLEPPMLGRVEISIRHAAGSLEVNITATHSEVLRQLNTVSDNLRSDLAQRQYTDVSVNVSQATPRAQAGAQAGAFGADAQGRGRQQGQDQDERAPGAALAEANQSTTAFSLGGRA